jgi:flavin-dependent dehydrogenase
VWEHVTPHAYWIRGLRLVTPGDREVYLSGGDTATAIICCRPILDQLLLQRALSFGTRFIPHFEAKELLYEEGRVAGVAARDGRSIKATTQLWPTALTAGLL